MVPEPVDQWQNVGGKGGNMLDKFYSDPQRYAYTFQNYVFITRVMQVRHARCCGNVADLASTKQTSCCWRSPGTVELQRTIRESSAAFELATFASPQARMCCGHLTASQKEAEGAQGILHNERQDCLLR